MRPLFVITLQPFGTDLSHLVQRLKHIRIEDFGAIRPVIALDQGVLIRFARLDVPQLNGPFLTPGDEPVGEEFWAIIEPNRQGLPPPAHHLLEYANHALGWERRIDLNRQALPYAFIQHIEGPEASAAVQGVTHEVHGPHGVRVRNHAQRLSQASGKPLLRPTGEIQAELTVHPPQPLMIPRLSIQSESPPALPKAPAALDRDEHRQRRNHRRIPLSPVHERPVVRGSS